MESLTQTVATIFKKLVIHLDKDELREEVNDHLLQMMKCSSTEEEYTKNLLKAIVFQVESTKALHGILQPVLLNAKYPNLDGVSQLMNHAQVRIENDLEELIPLYRDRIEGEESNNDFVTQLEIYFTTSFTELRLTYRFVDAFGTDSNKELFQPLFDFTAEEVGESILKYTKTYASLLFERTLKQK